MWLIFIYQFVIKWKVVNIYDICSIKKTTYELFKVCKFLLYPRVWLVLINKNEVGTPAPTINNFKNIIERFYEALSMFDKSFKI